MAQRTCSFDGCTDPHYARGWCNKHWTRWKKHGDPSIVLPKKPPPLKKKSEKTYEEFKSRLAALGATLVEPTYLGKDGKHRLICVVGHETTVRPASLRRGNGCCRICAGLDSATAGRAFLVRLERLGATLLESEWLGTRRRHRVMCSTGHICMALPASVQQGQDVCRRCALAREGRIRAKTAEERFLALLAELGGIMVEPEWLGARTPHRMICPEGHACIAKPNNVQQGNGMCRECAATAWDACYVVINPVARRVKFGITSGNPRPRIGDHRRNGYTEVMRSLTIPKARLLETSIKQALEWAGMKPVQGREYFDLTALALILDVVDGYMPSERDAMNIPGLP